MSLEGIEKILVGCRPLEKRIAEAPIQTANAEIISPHRAKLPATPLNSALLSFDNLRFAALSVAPLKSVFVRSALLRFAPENQPG